VQQRDVPVTRSTISSSGKFAHAWRARLLRRTVLWLTGATIAVATNTLAQSGGGYDLHWNVVAAGGAKSSAAGFTVAGTAGQPVAGPSTPASAAGYLLVGGFWSVYANDVIFRNGFD
jgi:hypothetical protein